uniref:Secreted protein n=1 Tax=Knipowitschia caucasica TaxID=637954 RepID=A0AAV2MPP1_KNICA
MIRLLHKSWLVSLSLGVCPRARLASPALHFTPHLPQPHEQPGLASRALGLIKNPAATLMRPTVSAKVTPLQRFQHGRGKSRLSPETSTKEEALRLWGRGGDCGELFIQLFTSA